jgi:hypothetical protein
MVVFASDRVLVSIHYYFCLTTNNDTITKDNEELEKKLLA